MIAGFAIQQTLGLIRLTVPLHQHLRRHQLPHQAVVAVVLLHQHQHQHLLLHQAVVVEA